MHYHPPLLKALWHCRVFIGLKTYHCLATLVTCCLEELTDVTLAFEGANSKLLDVVSAAEECVDDSVVKIFKLRFVDISNLNFGYDIEAEVWSTF